MFYMLINDTFVVHTEFAQYCFMSSLIAISFLCSFGPVWYQPTILSLAEKKNDRPSKMTDNQLIGHSVIANTMVCVTVRSSYHWLSWTFHTYSPGSHGPGTTQSRPYRLRRKVLLKKFKRCVFRDLNMGWSERVTY